MKEERLATPNLSADNAKDDTVVWKKAPSGDWLPGKVYTTQEEMFEPHIKNTALPAEGGAWHLVFYTPRGEDKMKKETKTFLKNTGFPLGKAKEYQKERRQCSREDQRALHYVASCGTLVTRP